ncbi:MAG: LysR family transcriptional regulator [Hyphomicrobiales bacterium]
MHRLTDIDLRLVRIFRTIVECQSLAGAELVLNLSQSRISASLAELEARLGTRLCRRGRGGFALTEAGTSLYEASHELFRAVDRFCNRAGGVSANLKRVFRLGMVDAMVTNTELPLPRVIREFQSINSSVVIELSMAGPEDLEQQLSAGSRDALIMPCINKRHEFEYLPLIRERQSLYCGRSHWLFDLPGDEAARLDLSDEPFAARGYLHHFDLKRIGHREARATVEMMEAQLMLILSGGFIGYLPAHYARDWVERGELRLIGDDLYGYDSVFYMVTQRGGMENPLVKLFRKVMLEASPLADA